MPVSGSLSVCDQTQVFDPVNKQLNDKERVAAALENSALVEAVERCLTSKQDH